MPALPMYQQRTQATGQLSPGPSARSSSGEGIQALGQSFDRLNEAQATAWTSKAIGQARLDWAQNLESRKQAAEPGAPDFTGQALKDFDTYSNDQLTKAPSQLAKSFMRERLQSLRESVADNALSFEAVQRQANVLSQQESGIENATQAVQIQPDSAKPALAEQLATISALPLDPDVRAKLADRATQSIAQASFLGLVGKNPDLVLQELNNPKNTLAAALTVEQRNSLQKQATSAKVEGLANGLLDTYSTQGPLKAAHALETLKSQVPAEMYAEVQTKLESGIGRVRSLKQAEHVDAIASVYRDISGKSVTRGTLQSLDDLYNVGAFTPLEYAGLQGRVAETYIEQAKQGALIQEARSALASGFPLDPANVEALTALFKQDSDGLELGSQQWQSLATAYATRTQMLPTQATAWARQALRSPDPKIAANAASFVASVRATTVDAADGFDQDTKAHAAVVNNMVDAGTDVTRAVETAKQISEISPKVLEERKAQYALEIKSSPNQGALESFVGRDFAQGWFHSDPALTIGLKADFDTLTHDYYTKTGSLESARDLAWSDMRRVYGVSKVNGVTQMMALPPERFGLDVQTVRADVKNFITAHPQFDGSTADDVVLVPDALTLRQSNDLLNGKPIMPSYALITKSGDPVVNKDGVRQRFTLPNGDELAAKFKQSQSEAATKAAASIAQAKQERELLQQIRAMQAQESERP